MPTLNWIGKEKVVNHHRDVPFRVLEHQYHFEYSPEIEAVENGKGLSAEALAQEGNMIIHGDNLEALKALLPKYEGKVDCIYIDPPYNTGEERWVYNDNVNHPKIKKWLGDVVGKEGDDLTRHDKWLCMMYPRLRLLHKLLSQDGSIFISLDENELANMKLMIEEIFGGRNYITTFIWEKRITRENRKEVSTRHDYILCAAKNRQAGGRVLGLMPMNDEAKARYRNPDEDPRGVWTSVPAIAQAGHATPSQFYTLTTPSGRELEPPSGSCWRYTRDRMKEAIADNRIWFGSNGLGVPRIKKFLTEGQQGLTVETLWLSKEVGTNDSAKRDLTKIFEGIAVLETPKPYQLIERILQIAAEEDSIILDSFAGSGTTAHAVMNLNKQDGGNRKFILVEMEDYAETITAERVKRVAKGYGEGKKAVEGTGGSFDYYTLGEPLFVGENKEYLNEAVGAEKIREYIWYSETRTALSVIARNEERMTKQSNGNEGDRFVPRDDEPHYLGNKDQTAYYFFYEPQQVTTLDYDFLATIKTKAEQYVIYADNCLLSKAYMSEHNIIFKKIPRDISRF
ncbi:site-specific DNA-methyltransferase [Roseivirga seohaensis]|uniref:site-specific DNA-methyltransferase n=1 Tax=Roseivirga seohaensis TaxID=1914963 RepID=UPI003BA91986